MDDSDTTNVHRLILAHGRDRARQLVDVRLRPLVDIAAEVMADADEIMQTKIRKLLDRMGYKPKPKTEVLYLRPVGAGRSGGQPTCIENQARPSSPVHTHYADPQRPVT